TAYVNPYKFNAKELDSETGLYYYGARYYNPRISVWYGVDPLAIYNPVMETEFYGDGQHNGGIYNSGNLNPYIYCYQSPVKYIDPNGKQIFTPYILSKKTASFLSSAKGRTIGFGVSNPVKAFTIGESKRGSDNISSIVTRFATTGDILSSTSDGNKTIDEGSEIGAFRHSLWQATITAGYSEDIANQVGNAHEEDPNTNLDIRSFDNIADADQTVDLLNNIIGRNVGKSTKSRNPKDLANAVLEEFKNNGLYQARKDSKGKWNVSRGKLSEDKYNRYKDRLKTMNGLGRTPQEQKKRDKAK
ncbi:RHS repeat-associated core domain-containing protein, partial [Chryseobacterium sp. GP-SGM7]|uniref:RHS repeat-associated core domain-containing protein n=1 Tax=Chryseobacterium sp. GP-SGM7 TaxID=3411323 RepID=UPI003B958FB5